MSYAKQEFGPKPAPFALLVHSSTAPMAVGWSNTLVHLTMNHEFTRFFNILPKSLGILPTLMYFLHILPKPRKIILQFSHQRELIRGSENP